MEKHLPADDNSEIERFENASIHDDDLRELWARGNDPSASHGRFRASFNFDDDGELRLLSGLEESRLEGGADMYLWLTIGDDTSTIRWKFEDAVAKYLTHLRNPGWPY